MCSVCTELHSGVIRDAVRCAVRNGHTAYIFVEGDYAVGVSSEPFTYGCEELVGYARTDGMVRCPKWGIETFVDVDAAMGGN